MYSAGDQIIYGSTGVCTVVGIATRRTEKNGDQLFYDLKPLYADYTISAPVEGGNVYMRPVISKEEAQCLIDAMPGIKAEAYHNRVLRQLSDHYDELIKSHCCNDLIELTMSIYAKRRFLNQQKRKLGAVDEKYMRKGEDLLFGELAAALGIDKDQVPDYIAACIGDDDVPIEG